MASPQARRPSLQTIADKFELDDRQIAYARLGGVRTEADFYSFLAATPELGTSGLFDTPGLTERLLQEDSVAAMLRLDEAATSEPLMSFGATAPPNAPFQEGSQAPDLSDDDIRTLANFDPGPLAGEEAAGITTCGPWPVRNQGSRGTCVSFATSAAYELFFCKRTDIRPDLSEQFLYWAVKHHRLDPIPTRDGTWHEFTAEALRRFGICEEQQWVYDPTSKPRVSHHPPPHGASAAALSFRTTAATATAHSATSGKAALLLSRLRAHNGAAIALPVFSSPSGGHNWSTRTAQTYGEVQNPMPGWVASGGHAVCCVGFDPDPDEPLGGHFILRNSWGTGWGHGLPDPSYSGPEPGYGQVSASYVDRYLWEDCVF